MTQLLPVYSKLYMETDNDDWTAIPTSSLLHQIHRDESSSVRWICVLHFQGQTFRIALGDPVRDTSKALFVPSWFLHDMGVIGDGMEMRVSFEKAETLEKATRLKFSLVGNRATFSEDVEIRDLLESPLSQLGVLSKGQIIPIPAFPTHSLKLVECEPADVVFLDGNEVAFEMEEAPQTPPPESRQLTPFVSPLTQTPASTPFLSANASFFEGPMISSMNTGATLSNASQSLLRSGRFIPFQGAGRSLSER